MNLHELKEMVKEEYNKFMYEQEDDDKKDDAPKGDDKDKGDDKPKSKDDKDKGTPKKAKAPKVDVGADDLKMGGDENPEETLKAIYDMLKDFFEGDDNDKKDAPKVDAPKVDAPDMPPMPAAPAGDMMEVDGNVVALQERFKKLANIIK